MGIRITIQNEVNAERQIVEEFFASGHFDVVDTSSESGENCIFEMRGGNSQRFQEF
jgi:hypothetical protein